MRLRQVLVAVIAVATLATACGSSSTDDTAPTPESIGESIGGAQTTAVTAAAPAQVGSIGDAVEVAVEGLAGADAAACDLDHRTLADASEIYLVLNGSLPATQDALVEAQMLREPSVLFAITADGAIVPAPGSPCV